MRIGKISPVHSFHVWPFACVSHGVLEGMSDSQMSYGAHARAILLLGLPLIGGHVGQVAIGMTDTVMLGWYGVTELAAVTLGSSYFFGLFILGSGCALAVMPLVAGFAAEDDQTNLRRATRMGLWLSIGFSFLVMPAFFWSEEILRAAGQPDDVVPVTRDYLKIAGWGIFPALLVMTLKSYLAGLERTQIVFWMTMIAVVANAIGNYALIFGNWGFPEMGIEGAAIASVLTHLVMLICILVYALRSLPEHALFQRFWRPDWEMLGRVAKLGLPIGLTLLSESGLFYATALMMGFLGKVPLAAHGIAISLAALAFMVHLGLSNVATVRVGRAIGRGDLPHLVRGGQVVIVLSFVISAITVVFFLLTPEPLILLFMQKDEPERAAILQIGVLLLAVGALFQLMDGMQVVALGLLRGVQDTSVPFVMAFVSYWVVGIPVAYFFGFPMGWGGVGVWFGLVVGLTCASAALMWRFWYHAIRELELTPPAASPAASAE